MNRYLVLAMRKPGFDERVVQPHLDFLAGLRHDGKLEMTGGFSDRTGGAYVLLLDSLQQAHELVAQDPLATSGSSDMVIHEWQVR